MGQEGEDDHGECFAPPPLVIQRLALTYAFTLL